MSLFLKNLIFTLIVPGSFGYTIPVLILRHPAASIHPGTIPAALLILAGSCVYLWCLWDFATVGRGTPAPIDPPRTLVTRGLYNHVRNPMYVGVLTVIAGWALLFRSPRIVVYGAAVFTCVHLFIILYEEPHLRRVFGESYAAYCRRVNRWWPVFRRQAALILLPMALVAGPAAQEPAAPPLRSRLVEAAIERTRHEVRYDGSYRRIPYPGGDVPDDVGVCTDLIIRSYRAIGIDLQRLVHEDMTEAFPEYPDLWGLRGPDPSIDHRRVPNLRTFFRRHGQSFPPSQDTSTYLPGDIVTWRLPGGQPHIGLVTDRRASDDAPPLVVHNIGAGPVMDDRLFSYTITGHYRFPAESAP